MRVGFGYDIHPLVENRPLILAGVNIPFEKGLAGHSDGVGRVSVTTGSRSVYGPVSIDRWETGGYPKK